MLTEVELRQRVAAGELLVVLDGAVYDLGAFAEHHPGGGALLRRHAGKDASIAFQSAPHSAATRLFRENYRIATLERSEAVPVPAEPAPSRTVLGVAKSQQVPSPDRASSIAELVPSVLALVNHSAPLQLDAREVERQLRALCEL
jgi:cytochrome b involved in lipid metabolism